MEQTNKFITSIFRYGYNTHKDLILGLLIGLAVAWIYHKWIGNRDLKKSYEKLIASKDDTIFCLKEIIGGRLANIEVNADKDFFNRVKKYFRQGQGKQQRENGNV